MVEGEVLNIVISGKIAGEKVVLKIIDDGCGIPADKLVEICKGTLETIGIGIKNVDSRIKMCFGESYGVCIDSVEDEGTTVTITLPLNAEGVNTFLSQYSFSSCLFITQTSCLSIRS